MNLEFIIHGVLCDNPECDYVDRDAVITDPKDYLNKPCPKCGAPLLTKADYRVIKMAMTLTKIFKKIPYKGSDEISLLDIRMNGTGLSGVSTSVIPTDLRADHKPKH